MIVSAACRLDVIRTDPPGFWRMALQLFDPAPSVVEGRPQRFHQPLSGLRRNDIARCSREKTNAHTLLQPAQAWLLMPTETMLDRGTRAARCSSHLGSSTLLGKLHEHCAVFVSDLCVQFRIMYRQDLMTAGPPAIGPVFKRGPLQSSEGTTREALQAGGRSRRSKPFRHHSCRPAAREALRLYRQGRNSGRRTAHQ